MKVKIFSFLLTSIGGILPISHKPFFGIFGKKFRLFCAKNISNNIGDNVNIEKGAVIRADSVVGDNSGVGVNCLLTEKVRIGNDVRMGPECLFHTVNHKFNKNSLSYEGYTKPKEIVIEDGVWIGTRCIILGGVTIGQGSTIGAGSIVTKDMPAFSVIAGNPAKVVKKLV